MKLFRDQAGLKASEPTLLGGRLFWLELVEGDWVVYDLDGQDPDVA